MATRIRTLNFLPEIFKTTTNSQFLQATLDQIVAQPNTKKIEGYIGSKFGYGINAKDYYVTEPTKVRTDYQLDPGVVFTKANESTAQDFISYPGIIDALNLQGGVTNNNNRLFASEFYSWDSFTNLDKIINFNQYYWLPDGPDRVTVSTDAVFNSSVYNVVDAPNGYNIAPEGQTGTTNPTITLLRGGTYLFAVNQSSQFWIQGAPGVTGYSPTQPNLQTRDVLGVTNNGAEQGVVTFNVPSKNAQDEYNLPGNNTVDVVSSMPYDQVNGARVSDIGGIDSITSLEGLTLMFYNTGVPNETGFVSKFYDTTLYDQNDPALTDNFGDFEGGYYTDVNATFYTITYVGDPANPTIRLVDSAPIPTNEKITVLYGTQWISRNFFRNAVGTVTVIPFLSADLDTLYYQDGTSANKIGVIRIIDSNVTNTLNIEEDILGKAQYTANLGNVNEVVFTNGLKVVFSGDIYPSSYKNVPYYVEGVGTSIELIPVADMVTPELFTEGTYIPYDTTPYDVGNFDSTLYVPVTPDYITVARNSIDKNAWSRSNRWFHIDVINATARYNNNPSSVSVYASAANKAKRPIIEFYPNLRMFDSGVIGKAPVDFVDFRTTDAMSQVAGQDNYYPDMAAYTNYATTINAVTGTSSLTGITTTTAGTNTINCTSTAGLFVNDIIVFAGSLGNIVSGATYYIQSIVDATKFTISNEKNGDAVIQVSASGSTTAVVTPQSTTLTVASSNLFGSLAVGQYITDSTNILPSNSYITAFTGTSTVTITVSWNGVYTFGTTTVASIVTADTSVDNYSLFDGSRVIFAADTNTNVRNKIYVSRFSSIAGGTPVITLTEADDGLVLADEQTVAFRGYNNQGKDFYFDGSNWLAAQQKNTVNQAPKFDIFDSNGISLGNSDYYVGTSFTGSTLFSYGIGSGIDDIILGFPLRYSSVDNVGDISFDVSLNSDTFDYVQGTSPITENVNIGYVYHYTSRTSFVRQLGWQTAVSPSVQYQVFDFDYFVSNPTTTFVCDVPVIDSLSTNWPTIQVYINNVFQPSSNYTVTSSTSSTTISLSIDSLVDTVVQVLVLSDSVSPTAYYQIPINLNNNPLNADVTTVNVGDIRGQYQSMFYNNPNTVGDVFGPNNFRDMGNLVPYGNKIIQNSASLVLPGTFLRKQNQNLFDALMYNSQRYITFKTLLVDTVNTTNYSMYQSPSVLLDDALDQMTANKTDSESFFWSDMLPSKAAYISNTYGFANSLDVSIYPLSRIYDFTKANYYGVLVYLTRTTSGITSVTQLTRNIDYTVSTDAPSLTIETDLLPGDQIEIKEYNQTYGSYVPNTPTKLGLYPASIPSVVLDSDYSQPTYFILGHDGSYNKLYGEYDTLTGQLQDFRDQVLLEYEKRVYNNLKLSNIIPIQAYEVLPGFFRDTDYSYDEILEIYSESFLNWVGQNRVEYKRQMYSVGNEYTYNYRNSGSRIDNSVVQQGYWRGLYLYYYDTATPDTTPWEMLGYKNIPTWWATRYGPAPYTSDNLVLWGDLEAGIDWNNGNPVVIPKAVRPGLLQVLPVDSAGNLVPPLTAVIGNYNSKLFQRDWMVGDVGPTEFSYRRSSSYPFDLMRILAVTKPADFFNLAVDVDNYKYNLEFNQYLVNDRSHLIISDVEIYGSGTAKTSYINWIVDYEKQIGVDATTNITTLLDNLDVRLVYRVAGFSDKNLLKFYVEKGTPNSTNASLLIPDESYSVLLYDNQPFDKIIYSGVIVQITSNGYKVYGNSQTVAYFNYLVPKINGNYDNVNVEGLSVRIAKDYTTTVETIPYGTEFYTIQEVSQFLDSYGKYLESQGMIFSQIENGIEVTWRQMVAEFLYWAQIGWEVGSIANINPSATQLVIDQDSKIVQPLTLRRQNFVLNQNLYPIESANLSVVREGTAFTAQPLSQGDTLAYGQFNISNFEHGVVFDNTTLFGDIIYNLITGLRQVRIILRGTKTAEWNGTIDAQGFILNQDNIQEWSKEIKYTTGSIVKYKNKYWIALTIVQAKELFVETEWKQTDYNEIQKGLLPNSSTRSYESTLYYDVNKANLENDADLLSFSLIGYRPRDYLALADLTDITQINVYKNMIKEKGTLNAASAFKGASLAQGGIDYDIYENWAIKTGEFGGVLNSNFVDLKLIESDLAGNPSIVGLTNGIYNEGVQQEIPLYSIYNYGFPIRDPNILPTLSADTPTTLLPDAGYVNFNDVKMSSYFYSGLPNATNQYGTFVPLNQLYVRDYVWLANYLEKWQILTPSSLGTITYAKNNLNGTVTVTFTNPHNLSKYQIFAIVNFNTVIDGYYIVTGIVDPYKVIINLNLNPSITTVTGQGIGFQFQSQRVDTPADIINLPLLNSEFSKNKVWVDTNTDGSWAVYRKSLNYANTGEIIKPESLTFGSAVAYTDTLGYLIGDADKGETYRYRYNDLTGVYDLVQTLTQSVSFGTSISYSGDLFAISEPTGNVYIYQLISNITQDTLVLYQTIPAPGGVSTWGNSIELSGDQNWLYISSEDNTVYVYRKSTISGDYEQVTTLTVAGLTAGDNFGYSIATSYYGDTVVIGTPDKDYDINTDNWGYTYVFSRTIQNIEVQYNSATLVPQIFPLSWTPTTLTQTATATAASTDRITVTSSAGFNVGDPVVFSGTLLSAGAIAANTVYYVLDKPTGTTFRIAATRDSVTPIDLVTSSGSMTCTFQTEELFVSQNGTLLADSVYAIIGSSLYVYTSLTAGDIISVSGINFVLAQTLTTENTPKIGVQFGQSVDTTTYGTEILVGAPFELSTENYEGAVYRYTNAGSKYGMIIGTSDCLTTTSRVILINGFAVTITAGDATNAANIINSANITNVQATSSNGKLIISLISTSLATPNNKLSLSVINSATYAELGINLYTQTQTINCPHLQGATQFGTVVKFNEFGSFVASAPAGARYSATTFDFTDDENIDNDTIFDNNTTQWVDSFANAGAVYMFDYLAVYNEDLLNTGKFVYAQSINAENQDYGLQPYYGRALDFNASRVIVGTPNFRPGYDNGQVITYFNSTGEQDWAVYRDSAPVVDTDRIQNVQIYSAETNTTLDNLDYMDPLQGKLLGAVRENIDVVSNNDPAGYNNLSTVQRGIVWGANKVGHIWFNTSNTRFVNYHQNDVVYNSKWWGSVFPGSDIAVYSWISSTVLPINYSGPGVPYDVNSYSVEYTTNSTGELTPVYFFWVRNTNIIFEKLGKSLADSTIQSYIANPKASGISYMSAILPNVFGLYNASEYINYTDSVLHIGYSTGSNDDISHSQYSLIRANYTDDFLPGLPNNNDIVVPESLYDRMLDSLSGVDEIGGVVPNPYLPKPVQSGILARPRQSFFYNRFLALKNYLQYANEILAQYPIKETRQARFLNTQNPTIVETIVAGNCQKDTVYTIVTVGNVDWTSIGASSNTSGITFVATGPATGSNRNTGTASFSAFEQGELFNTTDYWEYANWWATGYDNNTKSALQVPLYADLATLTVSTGTIVNVAQNGAGSTETYVLNNDGSWTRIGLQNGTIQFKSSLWDYDTSRLGFGDNFFDTDLYDVYPSEETRYIVRSLNEEIYIDELQIHRNKSLILLFEYIQSETIESQNYMPWLNKTSFIDVSHTIRELRPIEVFQSDNQDFLSGYLNEVKPYHVVIKEFLFKYTGIDVYEGDITDFDLPATYNTAIEQFVTPELVYSNQNDITTYLPTDPIWEQRQYNAWINNYGLSITGQTNYPITTLASYIALNSNAFAVDNASGFPINGVVQIDNEMIAYSTVDRALNVLSGLTRGVNGTEISTHLPGAQLIIDLPAVLLLNGGRGYTEPPKVRAYIDTSIYPEPTVPAELVAVMNLDSVLSVTVVNPGQGYATLPKIIIDSATTVNFDSTAVNTLFDTIKLYAPLLQTGDLVQYNVGASTTAVGGLDDNQYYYVNVLETVPSVIVALYASYGDALTDHNRIRLFDQGFGSNNSLSLGAIASCVTTAAPIRENNITLRFDRTSYDSQVTNWAPAEFYGSYYAGAYNNVDSVSSSSITLRDTRPPIATILASAQGVGFEILDVSNQQTLTWSSRTRNVVQTYDGASGYPNTIRITASAGGASLISSQTLETTTVGFYIGMPVKFVGATIGGLIVDQTYYVKSLVNISSEATGFTLSATIANGVPGATVSLSNATATAAGLSCYVGELTNTAILTIDYPGIANVTATTSGTNALTVPLNISGTGGTIGFYTGLTLFFTGNVFGGVVENEIYYITSVIDEETFTISRSDSPLQLSIYSTDSVDDSLIIESALELSVNDPVIFSDMVILDTSVTTFGNIVAGTTYYISSIINPTKITLSESINGAIFPLTTVTADDDTSCILTDQSETIDLTTSTGSMTMNVNLPVSPGQITGQQFTLYNTSAQYPGLTGTNGQAIARVIDKTLAAPVNRVVITEGSGGLVNIYENMPMVVSSNIGNMTTAHGAYYVKTIGTTEVEVTNTSSSADELTCTDTSILYEGMPIIFSGQSLGGISLGITYFVRTISSSTTFKISNVTGGTVITLTNDNGSMIGTGEPYFTVSATSGGATFALTTADGPVTITQTPTTIAEFDISYILGGYRALIIDPGVGYAIDNTITILGTSLGGTTPDNDLVMTVNSIDATGGITSVIRSGTPTGITNQYWFKVATDNTVEVYENSILTVPVSGIGFPYNGVTSATVTSTTASNTIQLDDVTGFTVNDPIVFTGSVSGGLTLGSTYYIYSINVGANTITVSTQPGEVSTLVTVTTSAVEFSVAKHGDYALLPEPFYFNQSIVKYNNRVYRCIISNNDNEFIFGKWELLDSGSRDLNALDRIIGYYQPTVNMPGLDLTQLVEGITYPNSTYLGNAFAPNAEYTLDTILQDQPFYPTEVDVKAIAWDGVTYLAPSDTSTYSAILLSADGDTWTIDRLANQPIGVTDIVIGNSKYVITTTNRATPILISDDGITWISNGAFTPYSAVPFDETGFDVSSLEVASILLNSATYNNNVYVAVGENIVLSTDLYNWREVYSFTNGLNNILNGTSYVTISSFSGFVAVGATQSIENGPTAGTILTSPDGLIWTSLSGSLSSYTFNAVANSGSAIVVVGNNCTRYVSNNGSNWIDYSRTGTTNPNLKDVTYGNSIFVAVGTDGRIETSSDDGATWVTRTSGTTENLNGIVWNDTDNEFVVVGDNNTILKSSNGTTWTSSSLFTTDPTIYNVQGDEFTAGYGPEEMVPGVVSDNLTMTIATRPGTNWDATIYQHVGYNVVSNEYTPINSIQTVYSFLDSVQTPAQLVVYVINGATNLGTTLYPSNYTVDWINEFVTLDTPLSLTEKLRIDVYETGNGNQLVKANTQTDPIQINTSTGFNEIMVNCNYSAPLYSGSGVVRPGTQPIDSFATATDATNNSITVADINDFIINDPITFQGAVFGNIVEDTTYYVKTISYATGSITISDSYNISSGTAGPTFVLATATGLMNIIIQIGSATPWTDPIVYHNGTKLIHGTTSTVTKTKSVNNSVTCNNTATFVVNTPVVFSDTMFGNDIVPMQVYYIKTIVDGNEFTISATPGGAILSLADATGGATLITNDYAFGIAPNGVSAKITFAAEYDQATDYITYTLFGETVPEYGYTIPETELFIGNGAVYNLANFNGGTNPTNAVVEINGIRISSSQYTISDISDTLTFSSLTPTSSDTVSVTTYNTTDRQYLSTQYDITDAVNNTVMSIASISSAITSPIASVFVTAVGTAGANLLTTADTANFVIGQTIQFKGTGIGNVLTNGTIYFVKTIPSSTTFTISATPDLATTFSTGTGTGNMATYVGGQPAIRITTNQNHGYATNNLVRIDGTTGSVQLNNNLFYVHVISATQFDLYEYNPADPTQDYDPAFTAVNYPITTINSYTGGGYTWIDGSFILANTTASASLSGNQITCVSTSDLVLNTPIIFTKEGATLGVTNILGGIIAGTVYYVKEISNATTFKISATRGGSEFVLTVDSNTVNVTQWTQNNLDRLWVTINGYRVPSSSLRLNPANYLSILHTVLAGDKVTITSMMPSATPNEQVFIMNVNSVNEASAYRANTMTRTWLTQTLLNTDTTIYVNDVTRLTDTTVQAVTTPAAVDGTYTIGLTSDKHLITQIIVFNNTTGLTVSSVNYSLQLENTAPVIVIRAGVTAGDSLTITVIEGNTVYINGEQIFFGSLSLTNNTLTDLRRGVNGTGIQTVIPKYSEVYGILSNNRMSDVDYSTVWNSDDYNTTLGDPLQISNTTAAIFLNQDVS
jgi:hypothetical protein